MSGSTRLRSASAVSESLGYVHAHELVEISRAGEDGLGSTFAHCASGCLRHGDDAASLFLLDQFSTGNVIIIIVVIVVVIDRALPLEVLVVIVVRRRCSRQHHHQTQEKDMKTDTMTNTTRLLDYHSSFL